MKKAQGTLQTEFRTIIPLVVTVSKSRITNGLYVRNADQEQPTGYVYALHITPFISIGFVIPSFFQKPVIKKYNEDSP